LAICVVRETKLDYLTPTTYIAICVRRRGAGVLHSSP